MVKNRGVTLIDALVSLIVLSAGFLMILTIIPGTGIFIKSSENRLLANQVAQTYLEYYSSPNVLRWNEVSSPSFNATGASGSENITAIVNGNISSTTFTWNAVSSPVVTGELYNLKVSVSWMEHNLGANKLKQIELLTLVVKAD
ncbi:MAG: hypothetical protein ABRQ37_14740 [Candidatus Eremiobacterota bacterium]